MSRLERIRNKMKERKMDGILISKPENRYYFSQFTGSSGYVLITEDEQYFITDFRYKEQAAQQCKEYEIKIHNSELKVNDIINSFQLKSLGFEDTYVTVKEFQNMVKNFKEIELKPLGTMIEEIRQIKSDNEIELIKKAAQIADKAFDHILEIIRPGMTEKEVALELEFFMKRNGAAALSFESIVASGWRSALPHGVASDKVIEKGDFVTMDYGCVYNGYCSDMTRTIVMGSASKKQKEVYNTVLKAQEEALKIFKAGIKGKEADKVARDIIEAAGYGDYFGHGLGHGLGLEVHEDPRVSPQGESLLQPNHVVTDEPGIYIPEFGGVRIEDLIYITETGCIRLSTSTKELIEIEC